jgi:hypothetical protein
VGCAEGFDVGNMFGNSIVVKLDDIIAAGSSASVVYSIILEAAG